MKVRIATDRCHGHGQCNLVCPEIFGFDEQGFGLVRVEDVPSGLRADVEGAARSCPERAIEIDGGAER